MNDQKQELNRMDRPNYGRDRVMRDTREKTLLQSVWQSLVRAKLVQATIDEYKIGIDREIHFQSFPLLV